MTTPPSTRRANFRLFLALVIFAVALALSCFIWMRGVVKANGGIADPQPRKTTLRGPARIHTAGPEFVLRERATCST